jgi:NDP-sugar pyrophosphorylase family protein
VEAIILAGGKAERLGEAAGGRPKPLVEIGGRALAGHQVAMLVRFGVERVIVSCAEGTGALFEAALSGLGAEIAVAEERERLGRGGGIRFAAESRREAGDVFALNGDELLDVDLGAMLELNRSSGAAATLALAQPPSAFGVVDVDGDRITGFREAGRVPYWVNCGIYVLGEEALARFPERGDHETDTFPQLAAEGRLRAHKHEGIWLTVNTPKDLRRAEEFVNAHPEWLAA